MRLATDVCSRSAPAPKPLGTLGANAQQHHYLAGQLMAMAACLNKNSNCLVLCWRGTKSGKESCLSRRDITCFQTYRTERSPGGVWGCMQSSFASLVEDLRRNLKICMCDLEEETRLHHSPDQLCLVKPSRD